MLQCQQWQILRVEGGCNRPADDSATVDIGDECDVAEPGKNSDVSDVGDPELLRTLRSEPAFHKVGTLIVSARWTGGDRLATSANTLDACDLHQPRDLVATHVPSGMPHGVPHLPDPIDAVIHLVNPPGLLYEDLVPNTARADRPGLRGTVSARGDEPTFCRTEDAADGLDPELFAILVDERDHFVVGRSSSAAKNAEAAFRISFARRASASSRRSLRFSSSSDPSGPAGSVGP